MSASKTICSKCASFLGSTTTKTRTPGSLSQFATLAGAGGGLSESTPRRKHVPPTKNQSDAGAAGVRTRPRKHQQYSKEDSNVALFRQVVNGEKVTTNNKTRPKPKPFRPPLHPLNETELAARLIDLQKRPNMKLAQVFDIFVKQIWSHLRVLPEPYSRNLYIAVNSFFARVCDQLIHEPDVEISITTRVSQMYAHIGKNPVRTKNSLLLSLCLRVLLAEDQNKRNNLLDESARMWQFLSQAKRHSQHGKGLQFSLARPNELKNDIEKLFAQREDVAGYKVMDTTSIALAAIFNNFSIHHSQCFIPALLTTLAIVSDANLTQPDRLATLAPLLQLVRTALPHTDINSDYIRYVFEKMSTTEDEIKDPHQARVMQLTSFIEEKWPQVLHMLQDDNAPWLKAVPRRSTRHSLSIFHKQLRAAYQADNTGAVMMIWNELQTAIQDDPSLLSQMRNDPEFLDFWNHVWCAIGRPEMLDKTQLLMHQAGLQPTIKTYTAMMHGWKRCKDGEKIEALWDVLVSSGITLDSHIWTERISGLIDGGRLQAGVQALGDMFRAWQTAAKAGQPEKAVRPTIEVINATFSGLMRKDRGAAFQVLDWAGREGIEPNVQTYNILLQESLKNGGSHSDIQNIFKTMSKSGVAPDSATFTIILEEILGSMAGISAEEQVAAIDSVFADIKATGVQLNMEIYGKMLFSVSSLSDGCDVAVEAVLRHMRENGDKNISPHMALVLLERVMKWRDRSELMSQRITQLLQDHGFKNISTGDQRLWEHVMSSYAVAGDATQALRVYDELTRADRQPSRLFCLRELLVVLLETGEVESARRVVDEVLKGHLRRLEQLPERRRWSHHFWHMAYANGLLDMNVAPVALKRTVMMGST